MDQKKFLQIASILVAAVWIFCVTFLISAKIVKDKAPNPTTTYPSVQTTQPPTTTVPTTTLPAITIPTTTAPVVTSGQFTMGGNNVSTTVTVGDPQWLIDQQASIEASKKAEESEKIVPKTKKDIIDAYVKGLNALKDTKNVTVSKSGTLEVIVDDMTGGEVLKPIADSILAANQPVDTTYNFVNGTDSATGETTISAIAPMGSYAALDEKAVKSAKAEKTIGGGFKVTIALIDETQTHEKPAPNHATTVEVIDLKKLMPSGATISDLSILYSGTVIEATFDSQKRITSIKHTLPVTKASGTGAMKVLFSEVKVSMDLHGEHTASYTIKYN